MFTYIIPNRFFIFPTHVGKLLHLFQKKDPVSNLKPGCTVKENHKTMGFSSEPSCSSKSLGMMKRLPVTAMASWVLFA